LKLISLCFFAEKEELSQSSVDVQQPYSLELHQRCQLEVEEKEKKIILPHIVTALRPSRVFIVMKKSQSEARSQVLKMFEDCTIKETKEDCIIIFFNPKHRTRLQTSKKELWISFDSSIPEKLLQNKPDSLIVFLRTPSEKYVGIILPQLSPVSFISFHKSK
jgi:hypothetical protein